MVNLQLLLMCLERMIYVSYNELYNLWLQNVKDDNILSELKNICNDDSEIYERFYKDLEFGTAGLRGIIGAGTNRMNIYTVRRTTQGLADYLNENYKEASVAIAYDSRNKSDLFAKESACVLAANDIKAYITKELQPTPVLSFAVRNLGCKSGIMITASHNPAKYNGYKCYGDDGCQMTEHAANNVYNKIQKVDIFSGVKTLTFEEGIKIGKIVYIEDDLYNRYLENVMAQSINKDVCKESELKVVYTPLNGAGNKLVRKVLSNIGVKNVQVVKEQEYPDGNFPTCTYPNPEFKEALSLALDLAKNVNADLVLATDPDSDRVGIAVKESDSYRLLSGNEVGIILLNYILSNRKSLGTLPNNPVAVKTIVSSKMIDVIAKAYKCELRDVLTGFKYIGEQILNLEKDGEENRFIFGFEESYGYLVGTYVRDKDAVVASMLICEMAEYYRKQGKTLSDVINELYNEYGFYQNTTLSYNFEGSAGMEKMQKIMDSLRNEHLTNIASMKVEKINDYKESTSIDKRTGNIDKIDLPKSNVISYELEGGSGAIVRPSGTEPKIKIYVTAVGKNIEESKAKTKDIISDMERILNL